jgi:abequosyltransferase
LQKESNRPLLTIAIPTFNRCECLRELLDTLSSQIPQDGSVEVLISDNASADNTPSIVVQAKHLDPNIEYIRNPENLGADGNFLQCYERAGGKYVWIFSDDDLFRPGAIAEVLAHLRREEYDLVYVSSSGFTGTPPVLSPVVAGAQVSICTNAAAFVRRVHIFTTMISGNIINKDRVEEAGHEPFSKLVGSNLIQLGWTFTALRGYRRSLFIGQEMISYRLGNTGGYGVCRIFGPTLSGVAHEWLRDPLLVRLVLNASLQRLLPGCLLAANQNAHSKYLKEDPHAVLSGVFRSNFRYWVFDYPLIVLPSKPAWLWAQLIRTFNRIDRACGYPSLGW